MANKEAIAEQTAKPIPPKRWRWPQNTFMAIEHRANFWSVTAPPDLIPDDLRDSRVFGQLSARFRRWDRVEIRADDGSWLCIALIEHATPTSVTLRLKGPGLGLGEITPEHGGIDDDDPLYRIVWQGETDRWSVVRKRDGQIMSKGLASQDGARIERARLHPRPV